MAPEIWVFCLFPRKTNREYCDIKAPGKSTQNDSQT